MKLHFEPFDGRVWNTIAASFVARFPLQPVATLQQDVCSRIGTTLFDLRLAICGLSSANRGWVGFLNNHFSNPASRSAQRMRLFSVHQSPVTFCRLPTYTSETTGR
jgi:hypothetical protein